MLENNQENKLILLKDLGMIHPNKNLEYKTRFGLYKCYCGVEFKAIVQSVKRGDTKSCGCYQKQTRIYINTTHGLSKHRLYHVWKDMIRRCTYAKDINYNHYGERGIKVCERWLDINNFIEDMYSSFKDGLTLDRINPYGNYELDNCRWANKTVQARNTKKLGKNNTSGFRGVSWNKDKKKWDSRITVNYKNIYVGRFNTAIEAAKAYDNYVIANNLEHTKNFN